VRRDLSSNGLLLFKNLIFTVLIPGTFGVYLPMAIARATGAKAAGAGFFWLAGFGLLMLGALIYLVCVMEFAVRGRGTPAPIDAPKRLVVSGLYHYVRNPMYVGVLAVVLGLTFLTRSLELLGYAALLALVFHTFIRLYEEPALLKQFGAGYEEYCSTVPRWIPRLSVGRSVSQSD
jgi:protein-S-isoprenylcysteine O-methyltransferase Ste14